MSVRMFCFLAGTVKWYTGRCSTDRFAAEGSRTWEIAVCGTALCFRSPGDTESYEFDISKGVGIDPTPGFCLVGESDVCPVFN
jgi:hypothetical protein